MTKMSATKLEIPLSAMATVAALAGKRTSETSPSPSSASWSTRGGGGVGICDWSRSSAATGTHTGLGGFSGTRAFSSEQWNSVQDVVCSSVQRGRARPRRAESARAGPGVDRPDKPRRKKRKSERLVLGSARNSLPSS